jgi:hypothetical protein
LINEEEIVTVGESSTETLDLVHPSSTFSCGLLVYVSFSKTANPQKVLQAATTLVNLPILTLGVWGDGESSTQNVLELTTTMTDDTARPLSVQLVLVPQANLISKIRSQGLSIQYHDQADKDQGKELYNLFVDYTRALCLKHQCRQQGQPIPSFVANLLSPSPSTATTNYTPDVSLPPDQIFRHDPHFAGCSDFDDNGVPLQNSQGDPLTKSGIKKLVKIQNAHAKKHEKYLKEGGGNKERETNPSTKQQVGLVALDEEKQPPDWSLLTTVQILAGTFGGRQGLEIVSDMGPFCHLVSI